jgi:hypothetical protein
VFKEHEKDYDPGAWLLYSYQELGMWVHVLAERAKHRSSPEKQAKDIYDAKNYAKMIAAKLEAEFGD